MNRPPPTEVPWRRSFWSLIITQFQGAFSDNALKNLVILLLFITVGATGGQGANAQAERHRIAESVGALFSLPFILFSMYGGHLADRYSKRTITIGVKIFEVLVMLFVLAGFALQSMPMQLSAVFLMGMHSAFFGPSKYGLLPELLPEKRLSWGNGILELGTFTAIILGTLVGAIMAEHLRGEHIWSGIILIVLAVLGLLTSLGIARVPAANPGRPFRWNFLVELWGQCRAIIRDRSLLLAMAGNTYFNFLGALFLLNIFSYGIDVLHVTETRIGLLNAALAVGIGAGSFAAGYLSGGKIEYGLVPLGAVGLTISAALLWTAPPEFSAAVPRLIFLGLAGGFFIVPICALLQHRPPKESKGQMLATANWLSFVGIFLASGAHYVCTEFFGANPQTIFLMGGIITLLGAIYAIWLLPDALLRFLLWLLTHTLYRIRIEGRDHIPAKGGALFVCNHLSFIDALLLQASTDRQIRFVMYQGIYERPWIKPFARILGAIPISSELRPRAMIQSLRDASEAIRRGEVVCIFAEGQITRIGQMLPFRRGFERIMKDVEAPIIPVALDGVWGSIFSFEEGRFLWKWPRRVPYPVTVNYGAPLLHRATPFQVRQAVQELMSEAWQHRKSRMRTLPRAFVRTARRHPFRFAMTEAGARPTSLGSALVRTVFLARRLRDEWKGQSMVGVLLPASTLGALVNWAVLLAGKIPVNLNYTLSHEALASCLGQCGITTVLTSQTFLDRVKQKIPGRIVVLENALSHPSVRERIGSSLMAWLLPVRWLEKSVGCAKPGALDDVATVIFSSGSTGDPKGVMLSHYNVTSNIQQLEQTFALGAGGCVLGALPFFHSFGFTGTLALPATLGLGAVYHPNPLDAKSIGELVQKHAVDFLLATPTFLQLYLRGCSAEQLGSVRVVLVGAEKLPERLAQAFEDQFGVRPLEAYGCTECAPTVAVNTHDYRAAGFRQVGAKRGKIGHPLPGICVRILHPESQEPQPLGQPGLLWVRGPNVMLGYLGQPDKTAAVLRNGWYVTGDIATLDEDGFLTITDRLSRFSKIGGEMVPHIKIEERLQELAGITEPAFAVTGVPDEKRGERLIVLHRVSDEKLKECLEKLAQTDLPNLWKPRGDQFFRVAELPCLGTGKLDLRKIRELAIAWSASAQLSRPSTVEGD